MLMQIAKYIFIVLVLTGNIFLNAEDRSTWGLIKSDADAAYSDLKYFGNSFGKISGENLLWTGAYFAGDFLVAQYDEDIRNKLKMTNDSIAHGYFNVVNEFGGLYSALGLPAATYLTGLAFKNDDIRSTGRLMAESIIISGLINTTIKAVVGRARPYMDKGSGTFEPFAFEEGFYSFPSGHTCAAFSMVTIIALKVDKWWAYGSLYALAASTGVARIYFDKHWASDVVMGAAIGTLTSVILFKASEESNKENQLGSGFNISPSYQVFNISYRF